MKGATIGQYRVTGLIGQGGMGAVYAAEHALLGRPAAIKILLPDLSRKQDVVMRFFNEARAATAIRHPGIIEIYDFGWTPEGAAFIVMEHLQGETLGRRSERARFRWQAALAVARQIAGALGAAHGKGIVHRDLKPDNIFLVLDPEVPGGERIKLLDFGIAKLAGDTSPTTNMTKTGAVMGTPTYMAPEQCRGVSVDHRADLYSLGCIVFELCSGCPPFVGEGTGDVLAAHIHVPAPSLASLGVEVPQAVEELLQHLLAKSPAQRMPNAEALIRAIDAMSTERAHTMGGGSSVVQRMQTAAPVTTTLSGASGPIPRVAARRRSRWIAMAAAVTVVIGGVIAVVAMRGRGAASKVVSYESVSQAAGAAPQEPAPPQPAVEAPPKPAPSGEEAARPAESGEAAKPVTPGEVAKSAAPGEAAKPSPGVAEPAPSTAPGPPPPEPSRGDPVKPSPSDVVVIAKPPPVTAPSKPPPVVTPPRPHVDPITPAKPATIDLEINSVPAGAQVMRGSTVLGNTPYRGTLPRRDSDITLVIRLAGYADGRVVFHADHPVSEHIKLVRSARTPKANRDQSVNPFGN